METPYLRHFGLFFEETLRVLNTLLPSLQQGAGRHPLGNFYRGKRATDCGNPVGAL